MWQSVSRWPAEILTSLYLWPVQSHGIGLARGTNKNGRGNSDWLLKLSHKSQKRLQLLSRSLESFSLRKASHNTLRTAKQACGEELRHQQPTPTCQSWEWVIWEMDPPATVKPSGECSPVQYLLATLQEIRTELLSQVAPKLSTQKETVRENIWLLMLQKTIFWVTCYVVVQ